MHWTAVTSPTAPECSAMRLAIALIGLALSAGAAQATVPDQAREVSRSMSLGGSCKKCEFSGRSMTNATFTGGNFTGASLVGADLRGAKMHGVRFPGADFTRADLRGAATLGSVFSGAIFTDRKRVA